MKKILIILTTILFITGCGCSKNKVTTVDERHGKLNQEIQEKIKNIDFGDDNKSFENTMIITMDTIRTEFGIREARVENFVASVSYERDGHYYIAIKPKKGWEDYVKDALESYSEIMREQQSDNELIKNSINTEYNGYYIYISSEDNNKVLDILKANLK